jgi:hypothetical protein
MRNSSTGLEVFTSETEEYSFLSCNTAKFRESMLFRRKNNSGVEEEATQEIN